MEKVFNELESFDIHEQDSAKQKIAECFAASEYSSIKFQKYKKKMFPFSQFFFIIIFTLNFAQFQLKSHVVLIALIYNYNVASVFSATSTLIHQNV